MASVGKWARLLLLGSHGSTLLDIAQDTGWSDVLGGISLRKTRGYISPVKKAINNIDTKLDIESKYCVPRLADKTQKQGIDFPYE